MASADSNEGASEEEYDEDAEVASQSGDDDDAAGEDAMLQRMMHSHKAATRKKPARHKAGVNGADAITALADELQDHLHVGRTAQVKRFLLSFTSLQQTPLLSAW